MQYGEFRLRPVDAWEDRGALFNKNQLAANSGRDVCGPVSGRA